MDDANCGSQLLPIVLPVDRFRLTALYGLLSEIDYPVTSIYVDLGAGRRIDAATRKAGRQLGTQQSVQAVMMDCKSCVERLPVSSEMSRLADTLRHGRKTTSELS